MLVHPSRLVSGAIASFCGVMVLILTSVTARYLGYYSIGQPESKGMRQPWDNTVAYPYDLLITAGGLLFCSFMGVYMAYQTYRPNWAFKTDEEYLWIRHFVVKKKRKEISKKDWPATLKIKLTSIKFVYTHEVESDEPDSATGYYTELVIKTDAETHDIWLELLDARKEKLVELIKSEVARARAGKPCSTVSKS